MAHAKMDNWVNHIKRFPQHKNMANLQGKHGIFSNESTSARPPSSIFVDVPDGHHVKPHHRDREFGSAFTHTRISVNDTPIPYPFPMVLGILMTTTVVFFENMYEHVFH
jgi:hypothetical protein